MKLTIWSLRTSAARGNHIVAERQCDERKKALGEKEAVALKERIDYAVNGV